MRKPIAALTLALIATPVVAHDFWIQPQRFQAMTGAPVAVNFMVGHADSSQRWGLGTDRMVLLSAISATGRRDLKRDVLATGSRADMLTRFPTAGLHVIAMQSSYAFSNLPAIRFNDYAKAEGLTPIIVQRQRAGQNRSAGRERYSRRAKALVQVGDVTPANQALATRAIGLKLEIVPERNPYNLGASRLLPIRVMYKGSRLSGATVKLTNLANDAKPLATAKTDRDGRAVFRVPATGDWLVNVLWSETVKGDPRADFDTTFSSLTFGYPTTTNRR